MNPLIATDDEQREGILILLWMQIAKWL